MYGDKNASINMVGVSTDVRLPAAARTAFRPAFARVDIYF